MASQQTFCFDLSGFLGLPQSLALSYRQDWNVFDKVQTFNSNVSTIRNAGNLGANYYIYKTNEERAAFLNGQQLHVKRYPLFVNLWRTVNQD